MKQINLMDRMVEGYKNVKADKLLGIFGNPIKHTLSPVIHDTISDFYSLNERYIPFEIENNLGDYVRAAYELEITGLNITVPYKEKIISYLSDIDEDAKSIGAVNTLVRYKNGYKGYNTDMEGLYRSILEAGMSIKDNEIVMLGAGGAAHAVAYMCFKYGAKKVYIINRSLEKAEKLAKYMNDMDKSGNVSDREKIGKEKNYERFIAVSTEEYNSIPKTGYMFIQCTSVGLKVDDGLPLITDTDFYKKAGSAVDLIYNPAKTKFVKLMEENDIPVINGLKMLLYQGIIANEIWNGITVSNELSKDIYQKLCQRIYS